MNKDMILKQFEEKRNEVIKFYNYDYSKLNTYLCKLYNPINARHNRQLAFERAVYTTFEYLLGLTKDQIDTICYCYYLNKILCIFDDTIIKNEIYIKKSYNKYINSAYIIDEYGVRYYFNNDFLPPQLDKEHKTNDEFLKDNTIQLV